MTGFLIGSDGRRFPVRDGMIIGRVHGADLVVDDTKVSRKHARLIVEGGVAEIEDLGSSNGTLLNGKLVARRVLRSGDELVFGSVVFRYAEDDAPAAAAAPAAPAVAADDDVDLFGGEPAAPAPPRQPAAPPRPASAPPPRPAPPPLPQREVVEFADEVVEVQPAPRPAPAAPAAPPLAPGQVQRQQRVLQFSANRDKRGGALGDELGQMTSGTRILVYLLVAAGFAAVVWAVVAFMR